MPSDRLDETWEQVALVQTELAALLAAGLSPARAWNMAMSSVEHSGAPLSVHATLRRVHEQRPLAGSLRSALKKYGTSPGRFRNSASRRERERLRPWRELIAVIAIAEAAGLPLRPVLERLSANAAGRVDHERAVRVVRQAPASSAKVLQLLPFIGIALGIIVHGPQMLRGAMSMLGMAGVFIAVCCMVLAGVWNRRLLRSLARVATSDATHMRLIALALQGSGSLTQKLESVESIVASTLLESISNAVRADVARLSSLATATGMPLVRVLERTADLMAGRQLRELQRRAQALEVRLLLPLGLLGIPAFLLLTVVPFVAGLMHSTVLL